jgi:hypothetical protein
LLLLDFGGNNESLASKKKSRNSMIFKSYKSASTFAADYTSNEKEKWIVDRKDAKNRPISWVSEHHGAEFVLEHHEAR